MSGKCTKEKCSLCTCNIQDWRHRHPESSVCSFFKEETGLTVGNRELCVCGACNVSIRQALKARDNGEPYQLRRLKSKKVCCVFL